MHLKKNDMLKRMNERMGSAKGKNRSLLRREKKVREIVKCFRERFKVNDIV